MKKLENKHLQINIIIGLGIFVVALWLRYPRTISPFWTDEYSSVSQALLYQKFGLNIFSQRQFFIEYHNLLPHAIIASSFILFGKTVLSAKIPFVLLGALLPVCLFFVTKHLTDKTTAIGTTLFSLFSYWFITWSQQARGYPLQQILLMLFMYSTWQSLQSKNKKFILISCFIGLAGLATHLTFLLPLTATLLYVLIFHRQKVIQCIRKNLTLSALLIFSGIALMYVTSSFGSITQYIHVLLAQGVSNNLWYYHSFLWRVYGVITFLSIIGWIFLFRRKKQLALYLLSITGSYILFHVFLFAPYVSRYLLVIFPIIFLLASYAVTQISRQISRQFGGMLAVGIVLFIIMNGHIFSFTPKSFYSVNHDMREIALLDYDQVYNYVKKYVAVAPEQVAVIDTWPDRRDWYLSEYDIGQYTFRWEDNGLMKKTPFQINQAGEKEIILRPNEKLISNQKDMMSIVQSYPQGFLWIDDTTLPNEVIEYAKKNLDVAMQIDHYQFDDNPYSLWPATLYSWGIKE